MADSSGMLLTVGLMNIRQSVKNYWVGHIGGYVNMNEYFLIK